MSKKSYEKNGAMPAKAPAASSGEGLAAPTAPSGAKPNPVALLLTWSEENRKWYALSVLLAVIGVAGSIVPYYAAGSMVNGVLAKEHDFAFYLGWCGVAAAGYAFFLVFHNASTAISHRATFSTISKIRRRLAEKLTHVPMGYVLDTPSGKS